MSRRRAFTYWTGDKDGLVKKPELQLRIFAEGNRRRHFVEVYVWKHLYQMRAVHRGKLGKKILAFWGSMDEVRKTPDRLGRRVVSKKLGEIHLALKHCTYNTIAHEAYHATRHFALRAGHKEPSTLEESNAMITTWNSPEEINARFMGYLTDTIIAAVLDHIGRTRRR